MAAEMVVRGGTRRWTIPERSVPSARDSGVATREYVSFVSMKSIFRIRSVSRSVVCLDRWAFQGLFVFLQVSHGGLKLSHEHFQRLDSRLNLGSASRLGILEEYTHSPAEVGVRGPVQPERAERHGDRCAADSAHHEIRDLW